MYGEIVATLFLLGSWFAGLAMGWFAYEMAFDKAVSDARKLRRR